MIYKILFGYVDKGTQKDMDSPYVYVYFEGVEKKKTKTIMSLDEDGGDGGISITSTS